MFLGADSRIERHLCNPSSSIYCLKDDGIGKTIQTMARSSSDVEILSVPGSDAESTSSSSDETSGGSISHEPVVTEVNVDRLTRQVQKEVHFLTLAFVFST